MLRTFAREPVTVVHPGVLRRFSLLPAGQMVSPFLLQKTQGVADAALPDGSRS